MPATAETLPLSETTSPATQADVAEAVRGAFDEGTPVYPLGGQTSVQFTRMAKAPGVGLDLRGLNRIVDYPARDMTITIEAGVTAEQLSAALAAENQWLPIDITHPASATIGGAIASNQSGPRRYGQGTLRDYCIGVSAVDGRGVAFKGGGRVVKNVAGYDFCKLLTGSMGTLAVITQVTLKVRPRPEASMLLACDVTDFAKAEQILAALVHSETTPTAIELLAGPAWRDAPAFSTLGEEATARIVVGLEGTAAEVEWMITQLTSEWQAQGIATIAALRDEEAKALWLGLRDFNAAGTDALTARVSVPPSQVTRYCERLRGVDQCSVQAHAGSGIIEARIPEMAAYDAAKLLISELQPAAHAAGGSIVVTGGDALGELTRQAIWGGRREDFQWMSKVKRQFDPKGILNPGRFPYDA